MISEVLTAATIPNITNRMIYRDFADFPKPKVTADYPLVNYNVVWRRLQYWNNITEEY